MSAGYADMVLDQGWDRSFKWIVLLSVVLHLVFFILAVVLVPSLISKPKVLPPLYTVNLVSLSLPEARPGAPVKPATKPAHKAAKPAVSQPKQPAKRIPLGKAETKKTEPKVEKIRKAPPQAKPSRKVDPSREIDAALARVKTKVKNDESATQRIDSAIERLGRRNPAGAASAAGGVRGTGVKSELDTALQEYTVVMTNIINANWAQPPASLIRKQGPLRVVYIIQIGRDGEIIRRWFESKSGDRYLDQSAEKAVSKSKLPPLPEAYKQPYFEVGLVFTPSGLKNR